MLQVNFIMIYIILEISVLLEITRILKQFLRSIIDFLKKVIFFLTHNDKKLQGSKKIKKGSIVKSVRNLFRLKKQNEN